MSDLDPSASAFYWDRLISITDEIVSTLVRTSFSINVRESYDLSCVLFDADGHPIAQGSYSVPSFTGTSGPTIAAHVPAVPAGRRWQRGDVVATNDPWMGTGHLFDISVMRPVFRRRPARRLHDEHHAFARHRRRRQFIAAPTEIYEEGLRLPVCKLVHGGQAERGALRHHPHQCARQRAGDRRHHGEHLLQRGRRPPACRIHGRIRHRRSRRRCRAPSAISPSRSCARRSPQIPDGSLQQPNPDRGHRRSDHARLPDRQARRRSRRSTSPARTVASARRINVPFCYTRAWAAYSIKCLTCPETPNNEGQVRPITITAPENCILNASPPLADRGPPLRRPLRRAADVRRAGRRAVPHVDPGRSWG